MVPLEKWRRSQFPRVSYARLARELGVASAETVRRYCLPFDDPNHRHPQAPTVYQIFRVTAGAIEPNDLFPLEAWHRQLERQKGEAA